MKLAIISHTEHYTTPEGTLVGWSPTVNEINHLLDVFESIVHVAMLHDGPAPKSTMAYTSDRIQFVPLPPLGGPKLGDKVQVLWQAPSIIRTVSKVLQEVDYFQLRTPTGIGVFLIPYLTVFVKTKGWYKYAGNWNQAHPPLGYRLQRWMLKHQSRKVTINGHWPNQLKHCISFENPCLTLADLEDGRRIGQMKSIDGPLTLCFVGRLEGKKGVSCILDALNLLSETERKGIAAMHFVGEGADLESYKIKAKTISIPIQFHGALSRNEVFEIYKVSHAILMPTKASEGFPKVLAEAMNFGCVPVVSNISSICQYIKDGHNGFLIDPVTTQILSEQIKNTLYLSETDYRNYIHNSRDLVRLFTFTYYNNQILSTIIAN